MANPNILLFSRTAPTKKLEMIKSFTQAELLCITADTLMRIVKEVGISRPHSRDKELYISSDRRKGNNWNSIVEGFDIHRGLLFINVYVQYSNTDTNKIVPYTDFFRSGEYRGSITYSDYHGGTQTAYYRYDASDKAEVLRSLCQEYIHRKYQDKLG